MRTSRFVLPSLIEGITHSLPSLGFANPLLIAEAAGAIVGSVSAVSVEDTGEWDNWNVHEWCCSVIA